jgi:hypothetical protein
MVLCLYIKYKILTCSNFLKTVVKFSFLPISTDMFSGVLHSLRVFGVFINHPVCLRNFSLQYTCIYVILFIIPSNIAQY